MSIQTYSKYPLKVSPENVPCRDDKRRENARAAIWSTGFVWQAERLWTILQPLAQNNNPKLHNLMWLSYSPVSPPTQNLKGQRFPTGAQILCTCRRPHSGFTRANALQTHPRSTFTWSVGTVNLVLGSTEDPILKEKRALKNAVTVVM